MTFNEWIKRETGYEWPEFEKKENGTTDQQRRLLYQDYETYCDELDELPVYDFGFKNGAHYG